ncbi:MAG: diguanylate cyclase (GGDEF)-like protein [Gammaproteobacteria bacterium]|jgi:diguanylate cyclase (GGDEF)-like protein
MLHKIYFLTPFFTRTIQLLTLVICSFYVPFCLALATDNIRFDKLSVEDGLSQLSVTSILQDQYGFMWFGTQYGLNRFDGYNFQVFKHDGERSDVTLSANFIRSITEDPVDGSLWIGTGSGGISRFDPSTELFTLYSHRPDDPYSLSHNAVRAIFIDKKNTIWVGSDNGIDRFDRKSQRFHHIEIAAGIAGQVRDIVEDPQGTLWVATNKGLFYRTSESEKFILMSLGTIDSRSEISSLLIDNKGGLWIGTFNLGLLYQKTVGGEIQHFHHQVDSPFSLSHNSVRDILQMRDNSIWIGTDSGLNVLQQSDDSSFLHFYSEKSVEDSLSSSIISALYQDKSGIIWLGTWTNGINKVDLQTIQFTTINSDSERGSSGITQGQGNTIWFGGSTGLRYLKDQQLIPKAITHQSSVDNAALRNQVTGIDYSAQEPVIWLGTRLGLSRYHEQDQWLESVALKDTSIYSVKEDLDGSIWVGAYNDGLIHLERDSYEIIARYKMPSIIHMWQEKQGQLWVATGDGLFWVNAQSNELVSYRYQAELTTSISQNSATWMHKDSSNRYWVGTHGGFNQMTLENGDPRKASFTAYAIKDGLESDAVGAILDDINGDLWISTTSGISRFSPETKQITNFGYTEGALKGGYYAGFGLRANDKQIFFSGPSGLTSFSPENIRQSNFKPPVYFNKLRIFNQDIELSNRVLNSPLQQPLFLQKSLELDYSQSVISLDFTALDYAMPQKNRYAFRLAGFEKRWNYVDAQRRSATYTNLDPGEYELHLRGTNKDGIWSDRDTILNLIINPPWWMTWWAQLSAFLLIAVSLVVVYRLRVRGLNVRSVMLSQLVHERTKSLELVNRKLEKLSRLDHLTNISNRRDFVERADREFERSKRHKTKVCLVLADIDNFKKINDSYGHDCGDAILVDVARTLTGTLRTGDILARWGGEEFIILLPDTQLSGGLSFAEKMRRCISETELFYQGQAVNITMTLGLVQMTHDEDLNRCVKRADVALYKGKEKGRDQVFIQN